MIEFAAMALFFVEGAASQSSVDFRYREISGFQETIISLNDGEYAIQFTHTGAVLESCGSPSFICYSATGYRFIFPLDPSVSEWDAFERSYEISSRGQVYCRGGYQDAWYVDVYRASLRVEKYLYSYECGLLQMSQYVVGESHDNLVGDIGPFALEGHRVDDTGN